MKSEDIENLMNLGNQWADEWNPELSYIKTARIRTRDGVAEGNKQEL